MLHGFAHSDGHRIARAVETELVRLFAEEGTPLSLAQGGEMARLDGGGFEVGPGAKPEAIGAKVAQAVYGGLVR